MVDLQRRIVKIIEHKEFMRIDFDERNELIEVLHVLEHQIKLNSLFPSYNIQIFEIFVASLEKELRE